MVLSAFGIFGYAFGGDGSTISGIRSSEAHSRKQAVNRIIQNRADLIQDLMALVGNDAESEVVRSTAVGLLGQLRAEESVPLLLTNLFIGQPIATEEEVPIVEMPVPKALARIGMPAVNAILADMANAADRERLKWYGNILKGVLGQRDARALLADRIARERDSAQKDNMKLMLHLSRIDK